MLYEITKVVRVRSFGLIRIPVKSLHYISFRMNVQKLSLLQIQSSTLFQAAKSGVTMQYSIV